MTTFGVGFRLGTQKGKILLQDPRKIMGKGQKLKDLSKWNTACGLRGC